MERFKHLDTEWFNSKGGSQYLCLAVVWEIIGRKKEKENGPKNKQKNRERERKKEDGIPKSHSHTKERRDRHSAGWGQHCYTSWIHLFPIVNILILGCTHAILLRKNPCIWQSCIFYTCLCVPCTVWCLWFCIKNGFVAEWKLMLLY